MLISIIAAMDENRLIGRDNALPWKLPADMGRFRKLTLGKPVVMGRKTFASIGKPLAKRINIIMTRDSDYQAEGCIVVHSPEAALAAANGHDEAMIIGGASVYAQFLPRADRLYLTRIHATFAGNAYFPDFDIADWREVERIDCPPDEQNPYPYSFILLERRKRQ
jgi:dihydrofolate reductase